ncbi:MAG: hypothetical protein BWY65_01976 [Firmicutes bacterium ADurb.Bin373]|nr:hypothetical protein [Bacillota bacterium]OQA07163.1 MAG: hypothetical protein BWY65_01976 [Firmicutes bacterium ADurb.Bin373]
MGLNRNRIIILVLLAAASLFVVYSAFAGADSDPGSSGDPLVTQSYVDRYVQWEVVELEKGQVLKGDAGTEIIVRRGETVVIDPVGNGIPDLTAGADIFAGSSVPNNHLLLIPRDDGRAIGAKSAAVVMHRGGATVR